MYFEDEKENMTDDSLDDLTLDLGDDDDKSITWDDLLNDDSDIDLSAMKRADDSDDDINLDNDLSILDDDNEMPAMDDDDDLSMLAKQTAGVAAPSKDAFEVFGGGRDADVDDGPDDGVMHGGSREMPTGDTITPDLSRRPSARQKASIESGRSNDDDDDDDIYFEPKSAQKSSGLVPILVGILVACLFVGGVAFFFLNYGKSVAGNDANMLADQNVQQQVQPQGDVPQIADPNDPASALLEEQKLKEAQEKIAADKAAKEKAEKEKAEKEKQELAKKNAQKLVTLAVQNAGRLNPFVPPKEFDNSLKPIVSNLPDFELLSPPDNIPGEDVATDIKKLMKVTVSGILFDSVKPSAIVTMNDIDYFVSVGDMIDNYQIVGITRQYVAIKDGTNIYKAQVGENFSNTPGGMAKRQLAGARQYTSIQDVKVNVKDKDNDMYEDDVQVKSEKRQPRNINRS